MNTTGSSWNRRKGTPLPEKIQKPSDFLHEENNPQDHQLRTEKIEGEMLYSVLTGLTSTEYSDCSSIETKIVYKQTQNRPIQHIYIYTIVLLPYSYFNIDISILMILFSLSLSP